MNGTDPGLPDGPAPDGPAPGGRRMHPAAVTALCTIAALFALLTGLVIVAMARVSYYLPPPSEGADPVLQQGWNEITLVWVLGALAGLGLAVAGIVIGVRGLVRGPDDPARAVPARVLALPMIGMLLTLLAAVGALVLVPGGVY